MCLEVVIMSERHVAPGAGTNNRVFHVGSPCWKSSQLLGNGIFCRASGATPVLSTTIRSELSDPKLTGVSNRNMLFGGILHATMSPLRQKDQRLIRPFGVFQSFAQGVGDLWSGVVASHKRQPF